jgi:hypothetical protein
MKFPWASRSVRDALWPSGRIPGSLDAHRSYFAERLQQASVLKEEAPVRRLYQGSRRSSEGDRKELLR